MREVIPFKHELGLKLIIFFILRYLNADES